MSTEEFYEALSYVDASRGNRIKYANIVLNDMSLFPKLIDILFRVNDKVSCRAAWVIEFVCIEYVYAIVPYLDKFTENLKHLRFDSSIRPAAKLCAMISNKYDSKENNPIKKNLESNHRERMIETCFDWLIGNQKIAAKAHAMDTLFLLGKESDWVHSELVLILERDFPMQSAGYKVRAKRILQKIKKG